MQISEKHISVQDVTTPQHQSDASADSSSASADQLTEDIKEVTAGVCHYYQPTITRHAITGVF